MSLDAHPDREPPMEARVRCDDDQVEYVKSSVDGKWWPVGQDEWTGLTWAELAALRPDGRVDLP